jgi:alkylation response protein AidB-like acyl-CoA dehydrogenase
MPRGRRPGASVRGAGARLRGAWVVNGAWWWTLRTVDPDGTIRLVGAILRGTPNLPGAACRRSNTGFRGPSRTLSTPSN